MSFRGHSSSLVGTDIRHRSTSQCPDLDLPPPECFLDDDNSSLGDPPHMVPPGTPEEDCLLHSDVSSILEFSPLTQRRCLRIAAYGGRAEKDDLDGLSFPARAAEHAEQLVRKVWEGAWKVCHFSSLPKWLQDNDFLHWGHRPPLPSFSACFRSIFRIHTETGNIWTHLLGCLMFIGIAAFFLTRPQFQIPGPEKLVFSIFFAGAILCLGMSFTFHTVHCHSESVGKLFGKLDYCGIALLIIGSFVPWLYYGFYCEFQPKLIYLTLVILLGGAAIIVSLWDKFGEPKFRSLRAGVFMGFGLSGVIPAIHHLVKEGWLTSIYQASLGWLFLMACLYLLGAAFYTLRVPERFFPGKCDIWFHSHQIFHCLVIAAAFVHYHGITEMAMHRLNIGECSDDPLQNDYV